jgi:hypothetical protein
MNPGSNPNMNPGSNPNMNPGSNPNMNPGSNTNMNSGRPQGGSEGDNCVERGAGQHYKRPGNYSRIARKRAARSVGNLTNSILDSIKRMV